MGFQLYAKNNGSFKQFQEKKRILKVSNFFELHPQLPFEK